MAVSCRGLRGLQAITLAGVLAWGAIASAAPSTPSPSPPPPSSDAEDDLEVPVTRPATVDGGAPSTPVTPVPVAPATPPVAAAAAAAPMTEHEELEELRARLSALEAAEKKRAAEPPPVVATPPAYKPAESPATARPSTSFDASPWSREYARGFGISGYIQAQYQRSQLSADQIDANGNALNQDKFLVRRARLRVEQGWDFAYADIEIDGNNVNGLAIGLRRAEAVLLWRGPGSGVPWRKRDASGSEGTPPALPPVVLTVGLTDVPFGYEMMEPNRLRLFLERTTGSRAFFPGDAGFGGKVSGAVGWFRYALGAYDGNPVPDSSPQIAGVDFSSAKDLMGRFGAETQPRDDLGVSGGVSFIRGTGFHQGTAATKGTLQWTDSNGNGVVDSGEVTGLPGQAATASKTFGRWALGADVQFRVKTPIGRGLVYGEAYVGNNYDRGLFVADPVTTGVDLREVGWYAAYVQEVTRFGIVGLRVEQYNPNADATSQRAGNVLPLNQTITTWSPLVGIVLPERARLMFEYDRVLNNQGISPTGVPTTLKSDLWALRLQVQI